MNVSVFEVESDNTLAHAILHDQVQSEVLDEIVSVVIQRLQRYVHYSETYPKQKRPSLVRSATHPAIQRVQQRVAGAVGNTTRAMCLSSFAVIQALSAESALVDFACFEATEWHSIILQLKNYKM